MDKPIKFVKWNPNFIIRNDNTCMKYANDHLLTSLAINTTIVIMRAMRGVHLLPPPKNNYGK